MNTAALRTAVAISLLWPVADCLAAEQPNIVFILADDLSFRDLSCYGQRRFQTPHLDRLAQTGIRFTQAYAAAPSCAPSRGCLLTGLHTGHGPIRLNESARGQEPLRAEDVTIAEVLRAAGYRCGFAGKWGVGIQGSEGVPYKKGFDVSFGFYDQVEAHTYFPDYLWQNDQRVEYPGNRGFDMDKRYRIATTKGSPENLNTYDEHGRLVLAELPDAGKQAVYSEDEIEKAAVSFVRERSDAPFFLYFAPQLPHGPVIVDDLGEMAQRTDMPQIQREWAAMVLRLDAFTGRLVQLLKDLGQFDNTVIFFASDNGYSMGGYTGAGCGPDWPDDPWLQNKGPFPGGKFSALEGGIRVPFFVSCPTEYRAATVAAPVWLPDFFATACELAGIASAPKTDGRSLVPLLSGQGDPGFNERSLYFSAQKEQAVRMGGWMAFRGSPHEPVKLFLVEEDTFCDRDLAKTFPDVAARLAGVMDSSHTPHPWYWNPDESWEDYAAKLQKARDAAVVFPIHRPNSVRKLPWE